MSLLCLIVWFLWSMRYCRSLNFLYVNVVDLLLISMCLWEMLMVMLFFLLIVFFLVVVFVWVIVFGFCSVSWMMLRLCLLELCGVRVIVVCVFVLGVSLVSV